MIDGTEGRHTDLPFGRADWIALAAITAAALFARLLFVTNVHPAPISDFLWYYRHGVSLAQGLGYETSGHPTALWPIGWPLILSGIFRVFGPSIFAAQLFQAVAGGLTAALVFVIGRRITEFGAAAIGAATYAVLPSAVEWSAVLASDIAYALAWSLLAYLWLITKPGKFGWYAVSGVLTGAAALVRPTALIFWVPLLAYLWLTARSEGTLRAVIAPVVVVFACAAVVVAPMTLRNARIFGAFVPVSNNGGLSLYQGNSAAADGGISPYFNPEIRRLRSDPREEAVADRVAGQQALDYMRTHPLREIWLAAQHLRFLYEDDNGPVQYAVAPAGGTPEVERAVIAINRLTYYALMLCALAGIVLCLYRSSIVTTNAGWVLLAAFIVFNTLLFSIVGGTDRYRLPTMPFFAIFAGIGVTGILRLATRRFSARPA